MQLSCGYRVKQKVMQLHGGKKYDLADHDMFVGARRGGLNISETADLTGRLQ